MFILRRITSEGSESNICMGLSYNKFDREMNPEDFEKTLKIYHPEGYPDNGELFAFIVHENGSQLIPLFKKSHYYVMTSDGKTFDNVSFRG